MPFSLHRFASLRPALFHLTARANLEKIRGAKGLESAAVLMDRASDRTALRERRAESLELAKRGRLVAVLRDQRPLYAGNVDLQGEWEFGDLVEALNSRVFFWPGNDAVPIAYGLRHFQRYRSEDAVVLRIATAALFDCNAEPAFCRYNSGSPRCSGGKGSPRGPQTFVSADVASFSAGQVVEVTFNGHVKIPADGVQVQPVSSFPAH